MIAYLIKSSICLLLLLVFYKLLLEKEKMHQFNRAYLLGSVLFSFLVPLYVINIYVPVETLDFPLDFNGELLNREILQQKKEISYWTIAGILSLVISTVFFVRFIVNLSKIILKIRQNTKIKIDNATLVLVEDLISPHTFWNYIFINKEEYKNEKLEEELLTHELTHVTQRHTIDVLLIELLKIIFWFNPLFYFLKKLIQLNHEFIADNKVIHLHKNISEYQHLLLNKAAWNNDYYLASNLNYSLTKKRLVMMSTRTSKVNNWLKKLAVIPLLTGSIYVFAERVESYEMKNNSLLDSDISNLEFPKSEETNISPLEDIKRKLSDKDALKSSIENKDNSKHTFLASIEKIDNNTILKCYNCERWAKLKVPMNKEFTITDWGFTNKSNVDQGAYAFTIKITNNEVYFKGLKNTAWKTLGFTLHPNKKQYINQNGMIANKKEKTTQKATKRNLKSEANHIKETSIQATNSEISYSSEQRKKGTTQKVYTTELSQKNIDPLKVEIQKSAKSSNQEINKLDIDQSEKISDYKKLKKKYDKLRQLKPHYIESEPERKNELDQLYSDLGSKYFRLTRENRRKINRAVRPYAPYVKIKKVNDFYYRLPSELTEEDKLYIPPPPPAPDASEEEKQKVKEAYRKWLNQTRKYSKDKKARPVKIEVKDKSKKGMVKINNQDLYYITNTKGTKYYNRWGQEVNKNGEIINPEKKFPVVKKGDKTNIPPPPPPPKQKVLKQTPSKGTVKVDDKTIYYITNKEGTRYYNRWGQQVNKKGEIINPEKKFPVVKKTDETNIPPPPPPPVKRQ
ncbi:beta-lactamase regulating signal transducer with metallopeptidase domain [Tenacibaculum skagerrakense]|uniref:Beta-lactamase regulating signal transducer with metallopeptidase domain n=1 Tax=Tenacibaculum skagerrakense TaxID=186571 RepID=A0A4R2NQK5_9FLAO|nr:M56 family metallopeptidase [Tenacibaculum skagerrakense]TCP23605.1 beta-lactamase regulating signal transducer with metallopeptidase domain [Tenacibaculum skagerrakense]